MIVTNRQKNSIDFFIESGILHKVSVLNTPCKIFYLGVYFHSLKGISK
ncbi:hypothetical protein AT05_00855 [Schleiferia thermophila str. Yellowstone]|nr:hypothetical protein AT05_00855 [Schleiferia thermophila str. Yellowstone]